MIFEMFNYNEITENQGCQMLSRIFEDKLVELENKDKTSKLWITYFRMVTILKDFIAADLMGDWNLHLHSAELMIPLFDASGHFPYAKAAQIYLQDMKEHSPFPDTDAIMSIATGITGDKSINCYNAFEEGLKVMKKIEGKNVRELKFLRKDKINSLLAKNNKIKIHDNVIPVDPLLLFQRICVLKKTDDELKTYMNYELAPYPLALFEDGQLRKTKKSTFYELFPEIQISFIMLLMEACCYIVANGN